MGCNLDNGAQNPHRALIQYAFGDDEFDQRLDELKALEADLITTPDNQFRFHSGIPT